MARHLYRKATDLITQEDLLKRQDSVLIGYKEICEYMRLGPDALRKWIRKHRFPVAIINKKAYTTRTLIDQYFLMLSQLQFDAHKKNEESDGKENTSRKNSANETNE